MPNNYDKVDNKVDNKDGPTRINLVYVLRPDSVNNMREAWLCMVRQNERRLAQTPRRRTPES